MSKIALVSCVSKKESFSGRAENLYISDWFKKIRIYVKSNYDDWFILSAYYGLISPDIVIHPYNKTLNTMSKKERELWFEQLIKPTLEKLKDNDFYIFAGQRYREFIEPWLLENNINYQIPMKNLPIGKQLAWLKKRTNIKNASLF